MNTLSLDLGIQEFKITDDFSIRFNPSDVRFVERLFKIFEEIEGIHTSVFQGLDEGGAGSTGEFFDTLNEAEKTIREKIDGIFGAPLCEHIFYDPEIGELSVFAASDGLHLWMNLFFALLDNVDSTIIKEERRVNPRMDAILAKYQKRHGKKKK